MTNFRIEFLYPWLLLLLIPVFALSFFLYFRISKRYRRTRNRIASMVLHFIVATLSILTLAGINFKYEIPNLETEVILLVDATYSGETVEEQRNDFIQDAIRESKGVAQIGVVTFGYGDPVYAVPLTTDTSNVYIDYLNSEDPDTSATDFEGALAYAGSLFKNPEAAKIVLISDGMETDGKSSVIIRELAAKGIEVNTVYFPSEKPEQEIQIEGIVTPDYNVTYGDRFKMTVSVRSSYEGEVKIELFDNGSPVSLANEIVPLHTGVQEIELTHYLDPPALHSLRVEISGGTDFCKKNNVYQTYINVEKFTKILMVERNDNESANLAQVLMEEGPQGDNESFKITTLNLLTSTELPKSVDDLRQYDQIILVNIANADMPEGFDELLYSYVNDYGGGLFTVGGNQRDDNGSIITNNGEVVPNAYNYDDMYDTLYQEMLPVQAIEYTPPVAVMIIVDRSGSMEMPAGQSGDTKLELAKKGALECLNALTERDYCGIMTLEEKYTEAMQVSPMTQMPKLQKAIDDIVSGGGTVFEDALEGAGKALQAVKNVERRHVILVTDGVPSDSYEDYSRPIEEFVTDVNAKVTFSFVVIGEDMSASDKGSIRAAAELGEGNFYDPANVSDLPRLMREELMMPHIKAINHEPFQPKINIEYHPAVSEINQVDIPNLSGFYGTKIKTGADMVLKGEFVPIYAQWKFGEGMVGSFMCDLDRIWSIDFMENAVGRRLILNMVNGLFPTKDISPSTIDVELFEQNYTSQLSVYSKLEKGETVEVKITSPNEKGALTEVRNVAPDENSGYSRFNFAITQPGVHKITITKKAADGKTLEEMSIFKTFSYSQEYNMFLDPEVGEELMNSLAFSGGGNVIDDANEIYQEIARTLKRSYDPRIPFMIITLVLFLADIAVRKFKFKWPHEIYRDAKAKRELRKKSA